MDMESKVEGDFIFMVILIISASFLNLVVIIVFISGFKLMPIHQFTLLSLTIADVISIVAYACETFGKNKVSCLIAAYIVCLASYASISHMIVLSIERVLMIMCPFRSKVWFSSKKFIALNIALSWGNGILWATFPWLKWGRYTSESPHRCSVDVLSSNLRIRSYNYSLFVFCYVVPLAISITSLLISKKEFRKMSTAARIRSGKQSILAKAAVRQEKQFTVMFIVMIMSFFLAWSPYALCLFIQLANSHVPIRALDISAYIAKCSTLFDPIIYVFMLKPFRQIVAKTFLACFRCQCIRKKKNKQWI